MSWQQHLTRAWLDKGLLARTLWPLSLLYQVAESIHRRRSLARREALPVPVLVIGNVLAGGVGKTPIVIEVVNYLIQKGWRVGVVSRGYGRQSQAITQVSSQTLAQHVGDEPLLIAQKCQCPVFVGHHRLKAAQALIQQFPDIDLIVSDDGLQHWQLPRDIEICVFDERQIGNGWLLPAGPLREPWPRKLTAPWCMDVQTGDTSHTSPQEDARPQVQRQLAPQAVNALGQHMALQDFSKAQALAGIAKPERFFDELRNMGIELTHTWTLPDHDQFSTLPAIDPSMPLLCTEKDAVKLWHTHPKAWAVPLTCTLPTQLTQFLDHSLLEVVRSKSNPV
jgi:tetraacyldisaccharide 4'-kinase